VDHRERLLSIWDTKFFKSRVVPIGADLCMALEAYSKARASLSKPDGTHAAFFAACSGRATSRQQLEKVFARLRQHAGLRRPVTERWQPRLHDL
jgi:site-specific recombinase XerD